MSVRVLESEINTGGSVLCVLCVFSKDGNNNVLFSRVCSSGVVRGQVTPVITL